MSSILRCTSYIGAIPVEGMQQSVVALVLGVTAVSSDDSYSFIVGTADFGHTPTELAHLFSLDTGTHTMTELDFALAGPNPAWICASSNQQHVYAANEAYGDGRKAGVTAMRADPQADDLYVENRQVGKSFIISIYCQP